MSIEYIDPNLPTTTKLQQLNAQTLELDGRSNMGMFDKNELDQIFSDLGLNRKYLRNQAIGNAILNYTNWTHLTAEIGYSIWKIALPNYSYNINNQLFFDNTAVNFMGQAMTEGFTAFDKVWVVQLGAPDVWIDDTSESSIEFGTPFALPSTTVNNHCYLGLSSKFGGAKFEFQTRGTNYNLKVEYFNGSWIQMTPTSNGLVDNTSNFQSDGTIQWTIPNDWTLGAVNGVGAKYWIRISTTTTPVTVAQCYFLIPATSVIGLLALSSSQVFTEQWAWCSFGQNIYVTIRNTGNSQYEGNYYISSNPTDTNKRNFFIYNHQFLANYQNSSFNGNSIDIMSGCTFGDLIYVSDQYTFNLASGNSFAKRAVGVFRSAGLIQFTTGLVQRVNTVGAHNIVPGDILYLSTTGGKVSRTAPAGSGKIQQVVGTAVAYESSGNVVDMIMHIEPKPSILP